MMVRLRTTICSSWADYRGYEDRVSGVYLEALFIYLNDNFSKVTEVMKLSICLSYDWAEKNLGVANFWVDDAGLLLRVDKIFLVVISRVWKTARATLASMLEQVCVTARIQRLDCFTTATLGENHTLMICCSLLGTGNPQFAMKFDPKAWAE